MRGGLPDRDTRVDGEGSLPRPTDGSAPPRVVPDGRFLLRRLARRLLPRSPGWVAGRDVAVVVDGAYGHGQVVVQYASPASTADVQIVAWGVRIQFDGRPHSP